MTSLAHWNFSWLLDRARDATPQANAGRARRISALVHAPIRLLLASLLWLALVATGHAQSAVDGFNPQADDTVRSLAVQPDGKLLLGGDFTTINGVPRNRIARLNADGSLDASFNPGLGANNTVISLALQPDGKLLMGGAFTTINGQTRNRIARLNADGSLDASFDPGTGANAIVYSLALQPDGKLLLGGYFTAVLGVTRNGIARLNADGSLDASFNPGTGVSSTVYSLALQPDGKLLLGGTFTTINGQARNRIARLNADGSLDASFDPGTGVSNYVYSVALQPDGKLLLGGIFTTVNGVPRNHIARLNADGSLDASFNPGTGAANGSVYSVALQPDGKLLLGGNFTTINGVPRNRIARLNADGSLDASFDPGTGSDSFVYRVAVQPDGKPLLGGQFTEVNGVARNHIARLNADGSLDASLNLGPGANGWVYSLAVQPDGKLLLGGEFTTINGVARNRVARLNADGSPDASFNPGLGADDIVSSLALQPDGKLLLGGKFTHVNGVARNRIARLNADGSLDASFNPGLGASNTVISLAVQPDGKLLLGGDFFTINGVARHRIARLNADGSLDASFNPGTGANYTVFSLALQPDGKLLLGGFFTHVNGVARTTLARLNADGSLDASFNPGTGANNTVFSLALQPDGKLLLGGNFTQVNGVARNRIARLNPDGSLDASFDPGTGAGISVSTLALQPDGKLLLGGSFATINGVARNRIARLNADGSLDASFDPGTGADNSVLSLALQPDGKLLLGGNFSTINGQPRNHIARLSMPEAALQTLAVNAAGNGVRWLRSGTGPALERVRFFSATVPNATGAALTLLGEGQFVDGAWAWSGGAPLPTNTPLWLHAEGVASSGSYNGSGSLYRSERMVYRSTVTIDTTALPAGTQGLAYNNAGRPVGTTQEPASYAMAAGSTLPAGLALDANTGAISGTPTTPGAYSFTLSATNASGTTWRIPATLVVAAAAAAAAGPVAIPVDAPWALALAAATLALLAWRQQRRAHRPR